MPKVSDTLGARVPGGSEQPDMNAGVQTWVLCKNNVNSAAESSLQSLREYFRETKPQRNTDKITE